MRVAVIGGDGIGPEVTRAALRVLDAAERRFSFSTSREEYPWSSARYVDSGERVGSKEIDGLRQFDAILFGALGDPRAPRGVIERAVILGMRKQLDLFVNLRPTMLDDPSWFVPFIETYTDEKLPWVTTPAVHSFPQFPEMSAYEGLISEFAAKGARPR